MEKRSVPADDAHGDDGPKTFGEKLLAGAVVGGLTLFAVFPVGLIYLLILLGTAAVFPQAIELEGIAPVFWALLLLAPCVVLAMAITVPVRHLARASLRPSAAAGNVLDAACSWVTYFLVGLMLLAWTPGVHAHSMVPAVAVATAGVAVGLLAERLGIGRSSHAHEDKGR
ncbi:hypothetical protein [Streptomyces glomeratus]|uniref:DUF2975 domain-containing protein n=1 Tax=Streptomyces glomeratus TaxID=284452 RepID=A0ABP6M4S0_9ACTN|nr:hypothetical protein [Streptomyces glomeratus]MCF1508904.1 hypothetical protein [Streptomyces glomeratus]